MNDIPNTLLKIVLTIFGIFFLRSANKIEEHAANLSKNTARMAGLVTLPEVKR